MWVKKTEKELMYDDRKRNVQRLKYDEWRGIELTSFNFAILVFLAVVFGLPSIIVILIIIITILTRGDFFFPLSIILETWGEFFLLCIPAGVVLAIFALFIKKAVISDKRKGFNPLSTQVCTKCNKVKADDGIYICDCGGEYILITKMKWVEPEESA